MNKGAQLNKISRTAWF